MRASSRFICTLTLSVFSGCSFREQKGGADSGFNTQSLSSFAALQSEVLQPKCVRCHSPADTSGGVDLSSYDAIVSQQGLVVFRDVNASRLYAEVASQDMPEGGPPLSSAEVRAIGEWILAGAPNGPFTSSPPDPQSQPDPGGTTPPEPATATFTDVRNQILIPACVRCHSGSHPSGRVDLTSFQAIRANSKKLAVAGDPRRSLLYTEIESGSMPPKGPRITADLVQLMAEWISEGAKND